MLQMIEMPLPTHFRINPSLSPAPAPQFVCRKLKRSWDIGPLAVASLPASFSGDFYQTLGGQALTKSFENATASPKKRVFLLDVNPLCYAGTSPSLHSFANWVSLFFREVSLADPVIAVLDGENGSEYRRRLLPSYKAHRWKFTRHFSKGFVGRSHQSVSNFFAKCNVPVVKIQGHEADDVIATLAEQALKKGYRVVIASPDKDFKQLLSEDIQIAMPITELKRWSFYTLKHYASQYDCDPRCDLSLRCILGDEADGVPGIQHVAPGFGRKTALKLLKKHGSLEKLLVTAAVRTVGKQYAQDALVNHADYLRRNYQVLALRSDVDVQLQEHWLNVRERGYDDSTLSGFFKMLEETKKLGHWSRDTLSK